MAIPFLTYIFIGLVLIEFSIIILSRGANYYAFNVLKNKKKPIGIIILLVLSYFCGLLQTDQISPFLFREIFGLIIILILSLQLALYKYHKKLYFVSIKIYRQIILITAVLGLFKFGLLLSGINLSFLYTKYFYPVGTALGSDQNFFALALIIGILLELFILNKNNSHPKYKTSNYRLFFLLSATILSTSRRALILLVILSILIVLEWAYNYYKKSKKKPVLFKVYKVYLILLLIFLGIFTIIFGTSDKLKNQLVHSISNTPNQFKINIASIATDYFSFTDSTQNYYATYSALWEQDLSQRKTKFESSKSLFDLLFLSRKNLNLIDNPDFSGKAQGWKFNKNSRVYFFPDQNTNIISIDDENSRKNTSISTKFRILKGDSAYISFYIKPQDTIHTIKAFVSRPELNTNTEIPIPKLKLGEWNLIVYSTKYFKSGFVNLIINNSKGSKYYLCQVSASTSRTEFKSPTNNSFLDSTLLNQGFYSDAKKTYQINQLLDNKLKSTSNVEIEAKESFVFHSELTKWDIQGDGTIKQLNDDTLQYFFIKPSNNWFTFSNDIAVREGDTTIFSVYISVYQWGRKQHFILRDMTKKVIKKVSSREKWQGDNEWHLLKYKHIALKDDTIEFRITNGIYKQETPKALWYGIQAEKKNVWKPKLPLPKIVSYQNLNLSPEKKLENLLSNSTFKSGLKDWYKKGNPNVYILQDSNSKTNPLLIEGKYSGDGIFSFVEINKDVQYNFSAYVKVICLDGKSFIRTKNNKLSGFSTTNISPNWDADQNWHLITKRIKVEKDTSIPILISAGKNSILLIKNIQFNEGYSQSLIADTILPNAVSKYEKEDFKIAMQLYDSNKDSNSIFIKLKELPDFFQKLSNDALYSSRIKRWIYALEIYLNDYSIQEKLVGNGFNYIRKFGAIFHMDKEVVDYPHNPILSTLLYSGIIGLALYLWLLVLSLILYIRNYNKLKLLFWIYMSSMFFALFSGNSHFAIPIFAILSFIPFLLSKKTI